MNDDWFEVDEGELGLLDAALVSTVRKRTPGWPEDWTRQPVGYQERQAREEQCVRGTW
ncbi:hypothetical protein [Streptomyces sp. NPDC048410]|uniref:hypothetical protein n=1 Tax=Streptomyces sp. NPDC048410 TaxID=3365545 RepID=UPI00371BFC06